MVPRPLRNEEERGLFARGGQLAEMRARENLLLLLLGRRTCRRQGTKNRRWTVKEKEVRTASSSPFFASCHPREMSESFVLLLPPLLQPSTPPTTHNGRHQEDVLLPYFSDERGATANARRSWNGSDPKCYATTYILFKEY